MLIPSDTYDNVFPYASLSRRVNANSQRAQREVGIVAKLIKKGEC